MNWLQQNQDDQLVFRSRRALYYTEIKLEKACGIKKPPCTKASHGICDNILYRDFIIIGAQAFFSCTGRTTSLPQQRTDTCVQETI